VVADGRWVAVEAGGHGGAVGVVPAAGGRWREVATTNDLSSGLSWPTWTHDSRRLAYAIDWANIPPNFGRTSGIFSARVDGGDVRLLVPGPTILPDTSPTTPAPMPTMPAYSPDGSRLAYVRNGDIVVAAADGTSPRRLTTTPQADSAPAWSPDGRLIAFERRSGTRSVIVVKRADGGSERIAVSSRRYSAALPSWRRPAALPKARRLPCA
jgi:dipeptidyl aminopeptidase/acylaminoacyl peptidase